MKSTKSFSKKELIKYLNTKGRGFNYLIGIKSFAKRFHKLKDEITVEGSLRADLFEILWWLKSYGYTDEKVKYINKMRKEELFNILHDLAKK